jgi:hypothetical protein
MDFIGVKNRLLTSQKNHSVVEIFQEKFKKTNFNFSLDKDGKNDRFEISHDISKVNI